MLFKKEQPKQEYYQSVVYKVEFVEKETKLKLMYLFDNLPDACTKFNELTNCHTQHGTLTMGMMTLLSEKY